jgi:hypothetical protein
MPPRRSASLSWMHAAKVLSAMPANAHRKSRRCDIYRTRKFRRTCPSESDVYNVTLSSLICMRDPHPSEPSDCGIRVNSSAICSPIRPIILQPLVIRNNVYYAPRCMSVFIFPHRLRVVARASIRKLRCDLLTRLFPFHFSSG